MKLTPDDIIEEVIDELATGPLSESIDALTVLKTAPGSLLLDFGERGRFTLVVAEV